MGKNFPAIFGGVVAYILLLLYACTVANMTKQVIQHGMAAAPEDENGKTLSKKPLEFSAGVTYVVTTIGGLVSALVVAKLALTKPGETPTLTRMVEGVSLLRIRLSKFLAIGYLVAWLAVGLAALIVGVMVFPGSSSTLSDIGTTWLGLAVAAGYAYFGLNPQR